MKRTSMMVLIALAAVTVALGVGVSAAQAVDFCQGAGCPATSKGVTPSNVPGNVNTCPEGTVRIVFSKETIAAGGGTESYDFGSGGPTGSVTIVYDTSANDLSFMVNFTTGQAVVVQVNLHGGEGMGGSNSTNIYDYSGFAAGGVTSDSGLKYPGPNSSAFVCLAEPNFLAASTQAFSAKRVGRAVTLRWRTASERNVVGFVVFRKAHGKLIRLSKRVVPAASLSGSSATHAYSFRARLASAKLAASSRYVLAEVHANGSRTWYGPVRAVSRAS